MSKKYIFEGYSDDTFGEYGNGGNQWHCNPYLTHAVGPK